MRLLAVFLLMIPFMWSFSATLHEGLPSNIIAGSLYPISFDITPVYEGRYEIDLVIDYEGKGFNQTKVVADEECLEFQAGRHKCSLVIAGHSRRTLNFSFMPGIVVKKYNATVYFYVPSPIGNDSFNTRGVSSTGGSMGTPTPSKPPSKPLIISNESQEIFQNTSDEELINESVEEVLEQINETANESVVAKPELELSATEESQLPSGVYLLGGLILVLVVSAVILNLVLGKSKHRNALPSEKMQDIIAQNEHESKLENKEGKKKKV